jgi:flagellar protein FliS
MQKGAQAYFSTHIATTDQGQLLLMLYDGALKFLAQAREKMLERDMAGKGVLISKAIDIVNELASSLNM